MSLLGLGITLLAGGTLGLFAAAGGPRAVDTSPLTLAWDVPDRSSCPGRAEVEAAILELLEPAAITNDLRASVRIQKTPQGRWRLSLTMQTRGIEAKRSLEDRDCKSVAGAAVAIMAWAIQPQRLAASPPATRPKAPSVSTSPITSSPPAATAETPLVRTTLELVGDVGTLPVAAPGVAARLAVGRGRLRAGIRTAYFPRSRGGAAVVDGESAGGDFSLLAGGLEGCLTARRGALALCVGPGLERVSGAGFGVSNPGRGSRAWLAIAGGLVLHVPVRGGWLMVASAGAAVPLFRQRFVLENVGLVHRPTVVAGRVGLGLGHAF